MRPVLLLTALALTACESPPTPPPPRRDAGARPVFPTVAGLRNVSLACFPAGFEATRLRVVGDAVELCGLSPGRGASCYRVNPYSSEVARGPVGDAPTSPAPLRVEAPFTRTEVLVRGGRASLRGGTLASSGAAGAKVAEARQLGFRSLENAVMLPWSGGHYVALIGVRAPDLGASALVDPTTGRMVGRASVLPCGDDGGM